MEANDADQTPTESRTEPKRFDADADAAFDATALIEGDRVDPALVAATTNALGPTRSAARDAPPTQLAEATITHGRDDVHSAILVDGESGRFVAASRHDKNAAWTQKEADWKVRAVGDRVAVTDATIEEDGNDEWLADRAAEDAEHWANVVLQEVARGAEEFVDELTLDGRDSLRLREPYGPTVVDARIRFEVDDE